MPRNFVHILAIVYRRNLLQIRSGLGVSDAILRVSAGRRLILGQPETRGS